METCPKIEMISFDSKLCNYDSTEIGEKILHVSHVFLVFGHSSLFINQLYFSIFMLNIKRIQRVIRKN